MNVVQKKDWLSALPLEQYGHKGEFIDAICLRYGYYHHSSHPIVCVARILVYPMPLAVHMVHLQSFGIMKLGI